MSKFAKGVTGWLIGTGAILSVGAIVTYAGQHGKMSGWTLVPMAWSAAAMAWVARLSGRGTLAYYRARHRPLAGPPPGARLPQ